MTDTSNTKVIAAVDHSQYADTVAQYGVWAAKALKTRAELLHVIDRHPERASKIDDHSGAIGFDAQETLLADLTQADEAKIRAKREAGRSFLSELQMRFQSPAVPVDIKQRLGELQDTLTSEHNNTSLYVLGRRGRSAELTQRDLGRNVERVIRALKKPILAVTEGFTPPKHAVFAFDGSSATKAGIRWLAKSPMLTGVSIELVIAGSANRNKEEQLAWAVNKLQKRGFTVSSHIINGDAETVIARQIQASDADLLVMGAYSHSPIRSLLFGSRTSGLLRSATIPALLLR